MKNTISFEDFCDGFQGQYKNNFSYSGKRALFNHLTDLEEELGEEFEFDPIELCCDYTEYSNLTELQKDYSDIETLDQVREKTEVIDIDGTEGFIIRQY